jgi:hypothetical protein
MVLIERPQIMTFEQSEKPGLKRKLAHELKELVWIFAYLWVLLGLFSVHRSIVLNEPNLIYHQGFAFINALVLAKVILIAEMLHVADNLKQKPLIQPIVFKSAVFSAILMSFYIIEETLIGMWHGKTATESIPDVGGGSLKGILVVGVMMFVVLMPFFPMRELSRGLGDDRLYELFFVRRGTHSPPQT